MNKVVQTTLTMSAVILISGCSSSGSHRSKQSSKYAKTCTNCGSGYTAVQHGHGASRSSNSGLVTVAGALIVGGLIYSALDDDDDTNSHAK